MFKSFSQNVILLSALCGIAIWILSKQDYFKPFIGISYLSVIGMVITVYISFLLMRKGIASDSHSDFMKSVGAGFAVKIVLSAAFLTSYYLFAKPASNLFILPFFTIYFLYTTILVLAMRKK